ncbi:MAG: non-heme iron oxygenase ferredoxin subunit [Chloroflexota bacterium]
MTEQEQAFDFIEIADTDEIHDGDRLVFEIDNQPIIIFRASGKLYAISGVCSHENESLEDGDLEETKITCPAHGARFDIRDGRVLTLPAVVSLQTYPIREADGTIEIGLPLVL